MDSTFAKSVVFKCTIEIKLDWIGLTALYTVYALMINSYSVIIHDTFCLLKLNIYYLKPLKHVSIVDVEDGYISHFEMPTFKFEASVAFTFFWY